MRAISLMWALACAAVFSDSSRAQELTVVADWPSVAVGGYTMAVLGDSGQVFIAGASTGRTSVHVHDLASGVFLGELGRRGEGPGEFKQISGLAFRDSRLAVADAGNHRITVFDGEWEVESTVAMPLQPVGSGLGSTTDGFVLLGLQPGCQPKCRLRLWLIPENGQARPIAADGGFTGGAIDHHYLNVGDSLLAMRHSYLGVWMIGEGGSARAIVDDSTFSVQTRDEFPSWFKPENGPVGGWLSDSRLFLVHDRYPDSQEFPVPRPDGGPPAPVEDRRISVLRILDARTGQEVVEQELPFYIEGVLAPGLLWGMELVGMEYHLRVWKLEG